MEEKVEEWRDVPDCPDYKISNTGFVKSFKNKKERILAGIPSSNKYLSVFLSNNGIQKIYRIHQLVARVFLGHSSPGKYMVVDHIDGCRINNNVNNLRVVTQRDNCTICFRRNADSFSSKYVGVCFIKSRGKWRSTISINGKNKQIGYFNTELEASYSYQNMLNKIQQSINIV